MIVDTSTVKIVSCLKGSNNCLSLDPNMSKHQISWSQRSNSRMLWCRSAFKGEKPALYLSKCSETGYSIHTKYYVIRQDIPRHRRWFPRFRKSEQNQPSLECELCLGGQPAASNQAPNETKECLQSCTHYNWSTEQNVPRIYMISPSRLTRSYVTHAEIRSNSTHSISPGPGSK